MVVAKMVKEFEELPGWVRTFYMQRLGRELLEHAREGGV